MPRLACHVPLVLFSVHWNPSIAGMKQKTSFIRRQNFRPFLAPDSSLSAKIVRKWLYAHMDGYMNGYMKGICCGQNCISVRSPSWNTVSFEISLTPQFSATSDAATNGSRSNSLFTSLSCRGSKIGGPPLQFWYFTKLLIQNYS